MAINKNTSLPEVIREFIESDSTKFDDMSKNDRIKLALSAYFNMHEEELTETPGAPTGWLDPLKYNPKKKEEKKEKKEVQVKESADTYRYSTKSTGTLKRMLRMYQANGHPDANIIQNMLAQRGNR